MTEPDRRLYLVFQVIGVGCFRCDESIKRELCAEAEAGDEAVEGGFAINGCPGINVLDESFLFLTGELIRMILIHLFDFSKAILQLNIILRLLLFSLLYTCFPAYHQPHNSRDHISPPPVSASTDTNLQVRVLHSLLLRVPVCSLRSS